MRLRLFFRVLAALAPFTVLPAARAQLPPQFIRGDVNADGFIDVTDAVKLLTHLFLRDPQVLSCEKAADTNDDGFIDVGDAVGLLFYVFLEASSLPDPSPGCGQDPTEDGLTCEFFFYCGWPPTWKNGTGIELIYVPPGTFLMGSPPDEVGRSPDELQHEVTLTCGFYLGKYEVTKAQWLAVMGALPPHYRGNVDDIYPPDSPIFAVSFGGAMGFCGKLGARDGGLYRLPTEAEWEYACRAGTTTRFSFGDGLGCKETGPPWDALDCADPDCKLLVQNMVFGSGQFCTTGPTLVERVGSRPANAWGFHDMHGNVVEWVLDWYAPYPPGPAIDPIGARTGTFRLARGADFNLVRTLRSAFRVQMEPKLNEATSGWGLNFGFRIVRETGCVPD